MSTPPANAASQKSSRSPRSVGRRCTGRAGPAAGVPADPSGRSWVKPLTHRVGDLVDRSDRQGSWYERGVRRRLQRGTTLLDWQSCPDPSTRPTAEVMVIGGGLMGRSSAWRLAAAGLRGRARGRRTGCRRLDVAAGMLAPVTETTFTEELLLGLNLASMQRYPDVRRRGEPRPAACPAVSARDRRSRSPPTPTTRARLGQLADYLSRLGLESTRLTSREARQWEPLLAPTIRGGLLVPGDTSCDNRQLLAALEVAGNRAGVRSVPGFVHHVSSVGDRVSGVVLADGMTVAAPVVVVANGAWAGQLTGIPRCPSARSRVRSCGCDPGRMPQPGIVVRAFTRGTEIYLVPRDSGRELVVGATVEELGFDRRVTAGGVYELLRDARRTIPIERGVRPGRDLGRLATRHAGQRADPRPRRTGRSRAGHRPPPQRGAAHPGHRRRGRRARAARPAARGGRAVRPRAVRSAAIRPVAGGYRIRDPRRTYVIIFVNGERREVAAGTTLREVVVDSGRPSHAEVSRSRSTGRWCRGRDWPRPHSVEAPRWRS